MKAWPTSCIVGAVAFTGIYLASGNRPVATVPGAMPEAAVTLGPALSAALPEASAGPVTTLAAAESMPDRFLGCQR